MTPEQESYYEETKSHYRNELLQLIATKGISRSQVPSLQGLGKLRQIANPPSLVDETYTDGSWKFNLFREVLQSGTSRGYKVLVCSQFVRHLNLFRNALDENGIPYSYLDGSTKKRGSVVNHFRTNEEIKTFLISIKAGGTGLNLTEADYVFILDPWRNPAVEQQAIDRSTRLGHTRKERKSKRLNTN